VYSFSCNNGTYDAIVDGVGVLPLIYRITEKDGQPFALERQFGVFLGLAAGNYNFQVEDACGNILNSDYDVPSPFVLPLHHHFLRGATRLTHGSRFCFAAIQLVERQ
jgi:hypothetical protein